MAPGGFRVGGEPGVEMVADGVFDPSGGFLGGEAVLGLADECGSRMKTEISAQPPVSEVVAGDLLGLAVLDAVRRRRGCP